MVSRLRVTPRTLTSLQPPCALTNPGPVRVSRAASHPLEPIVGKEPAQTLPLQDALGPTVLGMLPVLDLRAGQFTITFPWLLGTRLRGPLCPLRTLPHGEGPLTPLGKPLASAATQIHLHRDPRQPCLGSSHCKGGPLRGTPGYP